MSAPLNSLVTIPGCTATHVLGGASVDLADGDLTLVSTPEIRSPTAPTSGKKPMLTLTVGKAAFPLYKDTVFGTVSGDERVYIFQPDLGEDIKGCVPFYVSPSQPLTLACPSAMFELASLRA